MLMGAHDRAVDHRVFVVGIACEMLEYPLPHTGFCPSANTNGLKFRLAEGFPGRRDYDSIVSDRLAVGRD
jgi:hypothetical protein